MRGKDMLPVGGPDNRVAVFFRSYIWLVGSALPKPGRFGRGSGSLGFSPTGNVHVIPFHPPTGIRAWRE